MLRAARGRGGSAVVQLQPSIPGRLARHLKWQGSQVGLLDRQHVGPHGGRH